MSDVGLLIENVMAITVMAPKADAFDTVQSSLCVDMTHAEKCAFLISRGGHTGGTGTGTATITVEKCTAADGTGATAIAFKYKKTATANKSDYGSLTDATSAGFTTAVTDNLSYVIEVQSRDLDATHPFVRVKATEVVNDPVNAGIVAVLAGRRYGAADLQVLP